MFPLFRTYESQVTKCDDDSMSCMANNCVSLTKSKRLNPPKRSGDSHVYLGISQRDQTWYITPPRFWIPCFISNSCHRLPSTIHNHTQPYTTKKAIECKKNIFRSPLGPLSHMYLADFWRKNSSRSSVFHLEVCWGTRPSLQPWWRIRRDGGSMIQCASEQGKQRLRILRRWTSEMF